MKFYSLEAMRGIAAVLVVLHHSYFYVDTPTSFIQNSMLFVDFFFILSGFVIAFAYQDKINKTINFKEYFLLRFGRIYPLQLFTLLIWVPFILVKFLAYSSDIGGTNPLETSNLESFLTNLFLIQSFGIHHYESWNFPSWSISVEFYTYIIFFLFVVIFSNKKGFLFPLIISASSYLLLLYLFPSESIIRTYDFGILRCIGGFFIGVALYNIFLHTKKRINNYLLISITDILLIGLVVYFVSTEHKSLLHKLFTIISFALAVFHFALHNNGIISQVFNSKPFQALGKLSYSIYMVHAIIVLTVQNFFIYILKYHTQSVNIYGNVDVVGIVSEWSILINTLLVGIVIFISNYTYNYIEAPWRDKIRNFVKKRQNALGRKELKLTIK